MSAFQIQGPSNIEWTRVVKTADESVASSTVPQNDDELFFATVSGGYYDIILFIKYGSPAGGGTPDLKTVYGEDATARGQMFGNGISNTDTITTFSANADQTATIIAGTLATDRSLVVRSSGYIANGGTFRLMWAQNASGVNATIVRAGSELAYRRIS